MVTLSFGEMRGSSTSGVCPTRSSRLLATAGVHGCELPPAIAGSRIRVSPSGTVVEPVHGADVLAAEVDVHERCDPSVRQDLVAERGMTLDEDLEHVAHGLAAGLDLSRAADLAAQRRGNPDDGHDACT